MRSVAAPWMAWMLVRTSPFAETTNPLTMPVGPDSSEAGVTVLVSTSTTEADFAVAIAPAVSVSPLLPPGPPPSAG